jgi:hypothetical protein
MKYVSLANHVPLTERFHFGAIVVRRRSAANEEQNFAKLTLCHAKPFPGCET